MPPLPTHGSLQLPAWLVGLPWFLLAVALGFMLWLNADLRRQLTEKEDANALLREKLTETPPSNKNSNTGAAPRRRVVLSSPGKE